MLKMHPKSTYTQEASKSCCVRQMILLITSTGANVLKSCTEPAAQAREGLISILSIPQPGCLEWNGTDRPTDRPFSFTFFRPSNNLKPVNDTLRTWGRFAFGVKTRTRRFNRFAPKPSHSSLSLSAGRKWCSVRIVAGSTVPCPFLFGAVVEMDCCFLPLMLGAGWFDFFESSGIFVRSSERSKRKNGNRNL